MPKVGTPLQAIKFALSIDRDNEGMGFLDRWIEGRDIIGYTNEQALSFPDFCKANPDEPEHLDENGVARKDHYGADKQPWDTIKEKGWDSFFAAGNVIKYLRRTKEPDKDLEKARWYYDRLMEAALNDPTGRASAISTSLGRELTTEEQLRLSPYQSLIGNDRSQA